MNDTEDFTAQVSEMSNDQKWAMLGFMLGYCSPWDVNNAIEYAKKVEN